MIGEIVKKKIEEILSMKETLILAIDGDCGSGKSTFATYLQGVFDGNIFHMDDFFLPYHMRTATRLAETGGNIHYERFIEEVAIPLANGLPVFYRKYHCRADKFADPILIEPKRINIVEGVYSMHPNINDLYDYRIFMTVDPEIQLQRIEKRDGKERLQNYKHKWIPMEKNYFHDFSIPALCDAILETSDFGGWSLIK